MSKRLNKYDIYYQNVRGLRTKTNIFFQNLVTNNYKIIALTETFLNSQVSTSELFPDSYNVFRCDRNLEASGRMSGGGVLVAVSNEIQCNRLNNMDIVTDVMETVWVKLFNINGGSLYICTVYIRPKSTLASYQMFYESIYRLNLTNNSKVLIIGDFNLQVYGTHFNLSNGDALCKELELFLNEHNFTLKNNVCNYQRKTLDLVITNICDTIVTRCVDPLVVEDAYHPAIEVRIVIAVPLSCRSRSNESLAYRFQGADFLTLYRGLAEIDWDCLGSMTDVNHAIEYFYENVYKVLDATCPKAKAKRSKYPFWFTKNIISNIKLKDKFRKKFKKLGKQDDFENFKRLRSLVKSNIKEAYLNSVHELENTILSDSNKFWKFVKNKKSVKTNLLVMEYNNQQLNSGKEIVNAFEHYFSSVYNKYIVEPRAEMVLAEPTAAGMACLSLDWVTEHDVHLAIKNLKTKTTMGPDLLPQYLIKGCIDIFSKPLSILFNLSLKTKVFPDKWKITKITPIFKSGEESQISNYRPVAVLSVPAKVFEIIIQKSLFNHVKNYIAPNQHGFVPGRSVNTNLLSFTHYVSSGLDSMTQTDAVFLDLAKAFDKVDHLILLKKLHYYGLSDNLINFFTSYLINRKQYVFYKGYLSSRFTVQSGVPQGSNLGPCLFTIMINDLCDRVISSKPLLFADDLKLLKYITNQSDADELQDDLNRVYQWAEDNNMKFNISKCHLMSFSRSTQFINNNYYLNGILISRVQSTRDLGVLINCSLTFNDHINSCISSASKMMGFIIRQGVNFQNLKTFITLYNALVRSRLESAVIVWNPVQVTYKDALERVQKRFLRYLYFKCFNIYTYLIPYSELLCLFGFKSLSLRRAVREQVFLQGLVRGRVDDAEGLGALCLRVPAFNSRNKLLFELPHVRTAAHASSPFLRMMRSYNMMLSGGGDLDIFNDKTKTFKRKCIGFLSDNI